MCLELPDSSALEDFAFENIQLFFAGGVNGSGSRVRQFCTSSQFVGGIWIAQQVTLSQAGHRGSSGRYDCLKEVAFDYAFLLRELGIV
jgi:hypothetical protein